MIVEAFNIYCDETRVENPDAKKMAIGALLIPRGEKDRLVEALKNLRTRYEFDHELKWAKTSPRFMPFYKALIDLFVADIAFGFRCIIVDKTELDYERYHNDDKELAFFKFYYLMLRQKLLNFKQYYIFLDKKPTRDKNRARALHAYLESYILLHKQQCSIAHLQAYDSHENLLIQVADFLTGLVGNAVNPGRRSVAKGEIIKHFKEKLGRRQILKTSPWAEEKFNVFVWKRDHA